jgi:hypothetical protein
MFIPFPKTKHIPKTHLSGHRVRGFLLPVLFVFKAQRGFESAPGGIIRFGFNQKLLSALYEHEYSMVSE